MSIDWLDASVSERKTLYRFVKRALDEKNKTTSSLHRELFGVYPGVEYDKTFRSGRYDKKKAVQIFKWLETNHIELATRVIAELVEKNRQKSAGHIKVSVKHSNTDQLNLSLWLTDNTDETRFLYRSRAIPFLHPEDAFVQLERFRTCKGRFLWHVLSGPGGTGKSRLALEYAVSRSETSKDAIGFLPVDRSQSFDWYGWQPTSPTFIIIDYAAREVELVTKIIRILSMRDDLAKNVRLLLLEREVTGSWFDKIIQRGQAEHIFIEKTWFGEDGTLMPPDDIWPIIKHMCRNAPSQLPSKEKALIELERIDHQCRPLFAAFLGDAYFRGENPRNWDAYALVENVLEHEKRYWDRGGVEQLHINLCACATATGGVPGEWLEELSSGQMKNFWPRWQGNQTYEVLSAIYGDGIIDDIPPLEPDILGEVFFLQQWQSASRFERTRLLDHGSSMAPWFAEFLERLVSDFPETATFDLLKNALASDFNDYDNAKSELVYNIVTGTARNNPVRAQEAFYLFNKFDFSGHKHYAAECIIDAALNLIVGIENLEIVDALGIYETQGKLTKNLPTTLEISQSRCGLALSLIAKFPLNEPRQLRNILADTLKAHRNHRQDDMIRRDACIAISNYVNLLDNTEMKHAKILLRLFRQLAKGEHDGDLEDAWAYLLYHTFLLILTKSENPKPFGNSETSAALKKLESLAPETKQYKVRILSLLAQDLD